MKSFKGVSLTFLTWESGRFSVKGRSPGQYGFHLYPLNSATLMGYEKDYNLQLWTTTRKMRKKRKNLIPDPPVCLMRKFSSQTSSHSLQENNKSSNYDGSTPILFPIIWDGGVTNKLIIVSHKLAKERSHICNINNSPSALLSIISKEYFVIIKRCDY